MGLVLFSCAFLYSLYRPIRVFRGLCAVFSRLLYFSEGPTRVPHGPCAVFSCLLYVLFVVLSCPAVLFRDINVRYSSCFRLQACFACSKICSTTLSGCVCMRVVRTRRHVLIIFLCILCIQSLPTDWDRHVCAHLCKWDARMYIQTQQTWTNICAHICLICDWVSVFRFLSVWLSACLCTLHLFLCACLFVFVSRCMLCCVVCCVVLYCDV
jgi:hypothetical protein